jgi:hypothetical protein
MRELKTGDRRNVSLFLDEWKLANVAYVPVLSEDNLISCFKSPVTRSAVSNAVMAA